MRTEIKSKRTELMINPSVPLTAQAIEKLTGSRFLAQVKTSGEKRAIRGSKMSSPPFTTENA